MTHAPSLPDSIYSAITSRVETVGGHEIYKLAQIEICRSGKFYTVLRHVDWRDRPATTKPDLFAIASALDIQSSIARAINEENQARTRNWRMVDRQPALAKDGLETVAHQFGIERLLIGKEYPRRKRWIGTAKTYDDWYWRFHESRLRVISPERTG